MKETQNGLQTAYGAFAVALLVVWALVAGGDRLLFTRSGSGVITGAVQKRFVQDLPPNTCQSLRPTDHLEYRRERRAPGQGRMVYRCSAFGGGIAIWPFYKSFESTRVPRILAQENPRRESRSSSSAQQ